MRIDKILRDLGALLQPENDRNEVLEYCIPYGSHQLILGKKTSIEHRGYG